MPISLSDGYNTVDISKSTAHKNRTPRVAATAAPGLPADTLQIMNSEGFVIHVEGDWMLAAGQGSVDPDYRPLVEVWRRSNILINYTDGQQNTWYNIKSFVTHLTPGQPALAGGASTVIHYALDLTEALRTKEVGDLEENPITGGRVVTPFFVSAVSVGETSGTATLTLPALITNNGEIIVVMPGSGSFNPPPTPTVTDDKGNTYTRQSWAFTSAGWASGIYTAIAKGGNNVSTVISISNWASGGTVIQHGAIAAVYRASLGPSTNSAGIIGTSQPISQIVSTGMTGVLQGSLLVGGFYGGGSGGPFSFTPQQPNQVQRFLSNLSGSGDAYEMEDYPVSPGGNASYTTSYGATNTNLDFILNVIELKGD